MFYIQAPRYTPRSGGSIACHILCHELNRLGYEAYVRTGVKVFVVNILVHDHGPGLGPYTLVSRASPRSPLELAHLYRRSRGLIVFERTGARMEAAMCGCPVVAIPSESFSQLPLFHLYGNLGLGWGADVEQLHWAQRTLVPERAYRAYARSYPARLAEVVEAALRFFADRSPG